MLNGRNMSPEHVCDKNSLRVVSIFVSSILKKLYTLLCLFTFVSFNSCKTLFNAKRALYNAFILIDNCMLLFISFNLY